MALPSVKTCIKNFLFFDLVRPGKYHRKKTEKRGILINRMPARCGKHSVFQNASQTAKENLHYVRCPAITLKKIRGKSNFQSP
jgi:hypothetical protein